MLEGSKHMTALLRRHRVAILTLTDILALAFAYIAMAVLRYDESPVPWINLGLFWALSVAIYLGLAWQAKVSRGRATVGSADETIMVAAVAVTMAVIVEIPDMLLGHPPIARTVPFGAVLVATAIMVVARAVWRRYVAWAGWTRSEDAQLAVVVGAGDAGQQLVRSMLGTTNSPYRPVAFLDDDPWRRHFRFAGVDVAGTLADLESVVESRQATVVVIAIASVHSELIQDVSDRCTALGVDVKVLPPVEELFGDRVTIRDVRDINIADVLGRNAIETDIASIAGFLNGKRVLVTGAGGSIGSELARQISKWHPAELMMLDRDESGLHGVQLSITGRALLDSPDVVLCDIRDADALNRIFQDRRPEVVFHAAALKHLPMLEQYPAEAVKTNVLGTANVLEAARRAGVERFVNISTDKAANPTSVLGYSKRLAERLTSHYAMATGTGRFVSVRFGNVLGSRGSVIEAFTAQIARGGPITVTDPEVERFFMLIPEASQLVLQASAIGCDGDVLVLDMGQPVKILDVAKTLVDLSGRHDIDIVFTGLRPGEKITEDLFTPNEEVLSSSHPLITRVTVPTINPIDIVEAGVREAEPTLEWMRAHAMGFDGTALRPSGVAMSPQEVR